MKLKAGRRYWFPTVVLSGQDETAEWNDSINKVKSGVLTGEINDHGQMCVVSNGDERWWVKPEYLFEKDKHSANRKKK